MDIFLCKKLNYDNIDKIYYIHCSVFMARIQERGKAIQLRLQGKSYSEIKKTLGISKSTLHYWLHEYPLSDDQIRALRDWNPRRIENFRKTMQAKRVAKQKVAYQRVKKDIGRLDKKDLFIAGFFLYWGEGLKAGNAQVGFANTDPAMIKSFLRWLEILGVSKEKLHIRLHLYSDMDIEKYQNFWICALGIQRVQLQKPYIKQSTREGVKYKGRFGYGTCNVRCYGRDITDYVLMGVKYISAKAGAYDIL